MTVREAPLKRTLPAFAEAVRRPVTLLFLRDWLITILVIMVYFLLRGQAGWDTGLAFRVTTRLIEFEQATNTFWEPAIQQASIRLHWVQETANFIYAYMHFPVLGAVGLWLWFRGRDRFVFMRNTMFISMVFGILFYYLVPAAPPRLLEGNGVDLGFVDTVFGGNTSVSYAQPSFILNEYAAIPSFHFGWIALASACIWVNTRSWTLRIVAFALSLLMSWAIVASANHFFIDMALGGLVVAVSWHIARKLERRQQARASRPSLAA